MRNAGLAKTLFTGVALASRPKSLSSKPLARDGGLEATATRVQVEGRHFGWT